MEPLSLPLGKEKKGLAGIGAAPAPAPGEDIMAPCPHWGEDTIFGNLPGLPGISPMLPAPSVQPPKLGG